MAKRKRRRGGKLARITVADINAELSRRRAQAGALQRRHDELAAEVAGLRADLEALGSPTGAVPRGRGRGGRRRGPGAPRSRRMPKNKVKLPDALAAVLKGKTMSVAEAGAAVRRAGHKTNARNFYAVVSMALNKSGKFRRVSRGRYSVKRRKR
jgi:hypothetical protein